MKKIRDLIEGKKVHYAEPNWSVSQAAKFMKEFDIGAVAVLENGRMRGIFTERDIMRQVVAESLDPKATPVSEVMTKEVITATPDDSYEDCLAKMQQQHCRHLPIISGDHLLGIISLRDLLQIDAKEKLERANLLNYLLRYDMEVGVYD